MNKKSKWKIIENTPKYPNGGRTPIYVSDKNDPRLQAYQDSLDLYNFSQLQHRLEPTITNWLNPLNANNEERNRGQFELEKKAQDLVNNNPNIEWDLRRYAGTGARFIKDSSLNPNIKKGYIMNQYYPEIWKDEIEPYYIENQSPDLVHKTIQPSGSWWGKGKNLDYKKPVQPIIYQPEDKRVPQNNNGTMNVVESNKTPWGARMTDIPKGRNESDYRIETYSYNGNRLWTYVPNEQPINIQSKEGLLESNPINLGDINPIPFEQGTFFSRERQNGELDSKQFGRKGKKDYFDKKTGKLLGTYGDGGKISLDEFRPNFSNSNQNIQQEIIDKQKFENSKVVQQQKTLETIKNLQEKYREKYEPSQSVKNSKSFLSVGQLAQPLNLPLKAIATGADLETSLRYALDGQYNKSLEDLVQAGVNWIPFLQQEKMLNLSKGLPSLAYRFNEAIPKINQAVDYIQKGSDIKTITEVKKNGGRSSKWQLISN